MDLKFSSKPYYPTLISSIILFIFVFLPWKTATALGVTISTNGTGDWGILTLIMSIIGAGFSFVAVPRIRSLGTVIVGLLAIIGVAVYWSRLQGLGAGYGIIIALIASLALIAAGYLEYRKLIQAEKPEPPPKSAPPPTQPPQT
ncbi:MAG: hypothetical protein JW845_05335 [Dehalococcoidales bacterium]|nr:hypothetical protein [Dehalococcoidales bacterium]